MKRHLLYRRTPLLAGALLLVLLTGCPGSTPATLKADVSASLQVNPDNKGRASPITVRIYELKSRAAFESADFFSLWDRDREVLGADLVARDEIPLRPGDKPQIERKLKPETQFFAVVAGFRDIERAKWRDIVPVGKEPSTWDKVKAVVQDPVTSVTVKVDAKSVTLVKTK